MCRDDLCRLHPLRPPHHPQRPLYRQVMRAFLVAKERFAVHLRPEDVYAAPDAGSRPAEPEG